MTANPTVPTVSRSTAENLMTANRNLTLQGQDLEKELSVANEQYNTLAIVHAYIMERLRGLGMDVDRITDEARAFADSVSGEVVNAYMEKVHNPSR